MQSLKIEKVNVKRIFFLVWNRILSLQTNRTRNFIGLIWEFHFLISFSNSDKLDGETTLFIEKLWAMSS